MNEPNRIKEKLTNAIHHLQEASKSLCYVPGVKEDRLRIESVGLKMEDKLNHLTRKEN